MSVPGISPETLQAPRCSIVCTGPGVPLGGCTESSTAGGLIADTGGAAHNAPVVKMARIAVRQAEPARFID
ncbi:hypothetical protein MPSD_06660 [Mycobacterium pseudoshottsii JCM 15466]|nr:hypothetical protein MPSD_06660 [Mycobacterium pseudoshottsii JCM 15466]